MEIALIILALACTVIGVLGAILPALPGPPISFVGLLLLSVCDTSSVSTSIIVTSAIFAIVITLLDYVAPIWLTNKKGGSKYATWGAAAGMFAGLFLGPLGIIVAPFIGALIGEMYAGTNIDKAFNIAFISFLAFMLTTGMKLVYCLVLFIMVVYEGWNILWM